MPATELSQFLECVSSRRVGIKWEVFLLGFLKTKMIPEGILKVHMNKVQAKEIIALLIVGSAELEAGAPLI